MLINDASITGSLIVNASASLQNISLGGNIIPDETNLRNLGSTEKYFKEIYVSTGSINFVDGGTIVAVLNSDTLGTLQNNTASANSRLTAIESVSASLQLFTASIYTTNTFTSSATARLNALETSSASVDTLNTTQSNRLGSLETISASNISRITALETTSASVDTLNTTQNTRLTNLEIKTGSLATTGSNTFYGQQVFSGSLYVQDNLIVQGSSSLQNITASAVSIGTNIVNLNTANPAVRYGGISVQDSGSATGVTGSILWDSTCNRWIYSNPSGVGYSGGMLLSGPRASTLGTETTLTCNYIAKSGGGDHLYDSCIWEMSGSMGINTSSPAVSLHVDASGGGIIRATRLGSGAEYIQLEADGTNGTLTSSNGLLVNTGGSQRVNITSTGIACFSSQICAPILTLSTSTADYAATITNVQDSSQGLLIRATDNDTSLYLLNLQSSPGATCQSWVDRFVVAKGGNVGIGVSNPAVKLQINGSLTLKSNSNQSIQLWNSGSVGADIGGNLEFRGTYRNFDNDSVVYGKIFGGKENASDGNFAGYLSFSTYEYPNSLAERVRISSGGYLGIGTTNPPEPLSVSFAAHGLISQHRQSCGVGVGQNFYMKFNNVVGSPVSYAGIYSDIQANTNGAHSGRMILQVANNGSLSSAVTIANTGITTFSNTICSPIVARCASKWQLNGSVEGGNNACALVINIDNSRAVRVRGIVTGVSGQTLTSLGMYEAIVYRIGSGAGNDSKRFAVLVDCNASPGNGQGIKMDVVGDTLYIQNKTGMSYAQSITAWAEIFYA
jgi:hypothetical protein